MPNGAPEGLPTLLAQVKNKSGITNNRLNPGLYDPGITVQTDHGIVSAEAGEAQYFENF